MLLRHVRHRIAFARSLVFPGAEHRHLAVGPMDRVQIDVIRVPPFEAIVDGPRNGFG